MVISKNKSNKTLCWPHIVRPSSQNEAELTELVWPHRKKLASEKDAGLTESEKPCKHSSIA